MMSMSVVASSAFTTVTMDREASIDVVNDESGIIALQAHPDSEVVNGTDTGALQIDFDHANNGVGVNVNSTYTVGSTSSPTSSYAFNITNQNTNDLALTLGYALDGTTTQSNVKFQLYDDTGADVGTVSPTSSPSVTLIPGETIYVVVEVSGGPNAADDLSGTLTISA